MKLILGSGSPRRKELLSTIWHDEIEVIKSDIEEVYPLDLELEKVPEYLSNLKGNDLISQIDLSQNLLITADTVVILDNEILGKPIDLVDAKLMLHKLSGKSHQVVTGVCIYSGNGHYSFSETTIVHFKKLSESEIDTYVNTYQPTDKAGSYGIQEWIGMIGVEKIEGCFYNVMGLPTSRVYRELRKMI